MKEDYLWDKTGEDEEIAALENAMKAFRYRETAPPELPQKVFTLEKPERPRGFFGLRLKFAFASCASLVVILSLVWFQIGDRPAPSAEISARVDSSTPLPEKSEADPVIAPLEAAPAVETVGKTGPDAEPRAVKISQKKAPYAARPQKAVQKTKSARRPAETLTAEERYAYDQLMLALAITGSKLRIVRDKIEGIEEQSAALEAAK